MTRRFRTGLFIALSAAVGLHLRPCLVCLDGESDRPSPLDGVESNVGGQERPAVTAMLMSAAGAAPTTVR